MDKNALIRKTVKHVGYSLSNKIGADLLFRWINRRKITVLLYHGVTEKKLDIPYWTQMPVSDFENQIAYISSHYKVVPLSKIIVSIKDRIPLPSNTVAITFDDGYANNIEVAYPVLKKYGVPATIFLSTSLPDTGDLLWFDKVYLGIARHIGEILDLREFSMGQYSLKSTYSRQMAVISVTERLKAMPKEKRGAVTDYLFRSRGLPLDYPDNNCFLGITWPMARRAVNEGLLEFGAHTVNHAILADLEPEEARKEIAESKARIENVLQIPCRIFAYPNGDATPLTEAMALECGFAGAVAGLVAGSGFLDPRKVTPAKLYRIPRLPISEEVYPGLFRINISGMRYSIKNIQAKTRRMVTDSI